jgi:hypothetical protein
VGTIRRHPWLTCAALLLLSPLFAIGAIEVAQHAPVCSDWRAEVEEITDSRMRTRYLGDGDAQEFDRAYRHWETTFKETRAGVRAQVAHDLAEDRPGLCF